MSLKKYRLVGAAVLLLGFFSCDKDSDNNQPNVDVKQEGNLSLNLEAALPVEELRSLKYEIAPLQEGGIGGKMIMPLEEKPLHSICAISNEAGTKTYYFNLEWRKTAGENHFYVQEDKKVDIDRRLVGSDGKPIGLSSATEKWFISGLLTYDKSHIDVVNKTISYSPNANLLKAMSDQVNTQTGKRDNLEMDIPLYFDWIPLKVSNDGISVQSLFKDTPDVNNRIKMKPLGVMMRVEVTNKNSYPVKVKGMRVFSTVVNPSTGKISFANHTKSKTSEDLPYESQNTSEDYSFDVEDFTLQGKQRYANYFLLWGMPTKPNSSSTAYYKGRKFSQFLLDVEFLNTAVAEEDRPKMTTLYVWGSDNNNPRHNSRAKIDAQIVRPQSVLEYYSKGYAKQDRTFSPNRTLYQITKALFNQEKNSYPGWRALKYLEADIIGNGTLTANMKRNPNAPGYKETLNLNYPDKVGPNFVDFAVRIANGDVTEKLYMLRFDDKVTNGATNRFQYSAWRYTRNIGNRYGAIESIYLGPAFKGNIWDVAKEEFWQLHQADIVQRVYSSGQTDYVVGGNTSRSKLWDMPDGSQYFTDIEYHKFRGEILFSHIDEEYDRAASPRTGKRVLQFSIGENSKNGNHFMSIGALGFDGDPTNVERLTFCKSRPNGNQCTEPRYVWETAPFIMYMKAPKYSWK